MEVIEKTIPYKHKDVFRIYPLGDIHAGSIHCNEKMIKDQISLIGRTPLSFWVGMGDYADCIVKDDKRFDMAGLAEWVQQDNIVESQRRWVKNLFTPIKKHCLAFLTGNHEDTIHARYQDDITRNLCDDLKVTYGGYSCFIVLNFERVNSNEKHQIIIHAWHGAGAAQTEGARLMRLMRLVNEIEANIYLMGHLHSMTQHSPERLVCKNGKVESTMLVATITGSWLTAYTQPENGEKMNPSYGEIKGYKPNRLGCPVIRIKPGTGQINVEV